MNEFEEKLIKLNLWLKLESLELAADAAYRNAQSRMQAAELYEQALDIATSIDNVDLMLRYRLRWGDSLYEVGKLQQALTTLSPILQKKHQYSHPYTTGNIFFTMAIYISVAQELPVSLQAINKVYQQAYHFMQESGSKQWNDRLLFRKAKLLTYRGEYHKALDAALEGWFIHRQKSTEGTLYDIDDEHLNQLVQINIYLGDTEQAKKYLQIWQQTTCDFFIDRERWFSNRQSELAHLEGRFNDALQWARRGVQAGASENYLIHAFLSLGNYQHARQALIQLSRKWRTHENGHYRYELRRLIGDYHLACAQNMLEEPRRNIDKIMLTLKKTERAYERAMRVGKWIDERLECAKRQDELHKRLSCLESIRSTLG